MIAVCWCGKSSRPGIFTDQYSALSKRLKPLIALSSAHTVFSICLVKQLKCLRKIFTKFAANFHTYALLFKLLNCHFDTNPTNSLCKCSVSGCSSTTNAHSENGKMAVYCEDMTLGALSSCSAPPLLVGALFKKFSLFLNTPRMSFQYKASAKFTINQ